MSAADKVAQDFGLSILATNIKSMGDEWENLSEAHRENVSAVAMDYGIYVLLSACGDADVSEAMKEIEAAVSCWEFIAEDVVRRAMVDAAQAGLALAAEAAVGVLIPS